MSEPESWPDHSAELARKSIETLHKLSWRFQHGKLSRDCFVAACDAIMDVSEGLMPRDVFDLVHSVRKELCRSPSTSG